jgi:hypothetical protein
VTTSDAGADRPAAAWRPEVPQIRDGRDLAHLIGATAEIIDNLSAAAAKLGAPDRPELFGELGDWADQVRDWQQVSEVITGAERATLHADYRRRVALALAELARRPRRLAWTKLYPEDPHSSQYLVALDGRELGTVSALGVRYRGGRRRTLTWRARAAKWPSPAELELSPYKSIGEAARALAAHDQSRGPGERA